MKQKLLLLCFVSQFFCVTLLAQVTANQAPDIAVCEVAEYQFQLDGMEYFDLTTNEAIIVQGNTNGVFVAYYLSLSDAENDTNGISTINNYLSTSRTIFVRVQEYDSGNFATTSFNIQVLAPPFLYPSEYLVCDDEIADGIASFNSSAFYVEADNFYRTHSDAFNQINPLPTIFQNNVPYNDVIYGRLNNGICYDIEMVYLEVNPMPAIENPSPYEVCETNSDGASLFYLEHKIPEIQQGNNYFVNFYATLQGAENATFADRLPLEYQNVSNPQTIYIRASIGSCYTVGELELVVNDAETPVLNEIPTQYLCPSQVGLYDLTVYESEIVTNMNDISFSYYDDFLEMLSESNPITDPTQVELGYETRELYVRINNTITGCYSFTSLKFDFTSACGISCDEVMNFSFCQPANNIFYTFYGDGGSPLTLEINQGTIYTFGFNSGYIVVKDSDGSELYNGSGTPTSTNYVNDLSGLVFQSSGNTLAFEFYSVFARCNQNPSINIPLNIDVYCSQNVGLLKLSTFFDENANDIFDSNENYYNQGVFSYEKNGDGIITEITSSTGQATIVVDDPSDVYSVSYSLFEHALNCNTVTTSTVNSISVANGETTTVEFAVTEEQTCEDLAVYLVNYSAAPRPGFNFNNRIILENLGFSSIASGSVEFIHDSQVTFNSAYSNDASFSITNTDTGFNVSFANLQPGQSSSIDISLNCPSTAELGSVITNSAIYTTDENDMYAINNASSLSQIIIGSYDPNDIAESHGPKIDYDSFLISDEYLYYTIRFQNVGTAEAINIRIEDVLDVQLNASTFQMLQSSHDYLVTRTDHQLVWQFDAINLPSQGMNIDESQGYIYFKIKPTTGYLVGEIIPNSAAIYFDFNAPVNTNIFETEFVTGLSVDNFKITNFTMHPNPARTTVELQFNSISNGSITVHDIQGKTIVKNSFLNTDRLQLNVSAFESGLYFVKFTNGIQEIIKKLVIN